MTTRLSQILVLPGGRQLCYAEFGHPGGFPLFYFHGFPMSRLAGWEIDRPARRQSIRVIAFDRPGYGLSTFQPNRSITDLSHDVQALAQHIGISRFALFGHSGGCPYVLACAKDLPKEMIAAVGVLSGGPPWEAGKQHMPWYARLTYLAANYCPSVLRVASNIFISVTKWIMATRTVSRWIDALLLKAKQKRLEEDKQRLLKDGTSSDSGEESERDLSPDELREKFIRNIFEGFAQGSEGFVQEARLLSSPNWGFKFEDVEFDTIKLWHGTKDINSPVAMMRWMAKRLPHCHLQEFKDDDHYTMPRHIHDILLEFLPDSGATKREV